MNTQLLEKIAKQAEIHLDFFGLGSCMDGGNPDIGWFAELIVRECAEFADEHNSEVEGVTLGVGKAIKRHFGVES